MVEKLGYRADVAANGTEAVKILGDMRYDAVLMDCHMPEMDGFEATERIRGLTGPVALVPIVALTASAMPEDLEACRRAGMNDQLVKPISFATLQKVVDALVPAVPATPITSPQK